MFDLGKGDKEKLEENMEEIKKLVNEGQNSEKTGEPGKDFEEDIENDFNQENTTFDTSQNTEQTDQSQDTNPFSQKLGDNPLKDQEMSFTAENPENNTKIRNNSNLDHEFKQMREEIKNEISSIEETQQIQNTNNVEQTETPEKQPNPEEREIEKTDYSKNESPLFLEVENFKEMKQMVEEMHYLTSEIDDVIQHLEAGIQEDQSTMTEAEKIINEFQTRRNTIQQTLKNN